MIGHKLPNAQLNTLDIFSFCDSVPQFRLFNQFYLQRMLHFSSHDSLMTREKKMLVVIVKLCNEFIEFFFCVVSNELLHFSYVDWTAIVINTNNNCARDSLDHRSNVIKN